MDNVIGPTSGIVSDLVAGVAQADRPVAVVAGALAGEAESHGGLVTLGSILSKGLSWQCYQKFTSFCD